MMIGPDPMIMILDMSVLFGMLSDWRLSRLHHGNEMVEEVI